MGTLITRVRQPGHERITKMDASIERQKRSRWRCGALAAIALALPTVLAAQRSSPRLDSLIAQAIAVQPSLKAVQARVDAAHARGRSAGTLDDPMVGIGVMNLPVNGRGYDDMTMNAVSLQQALPFPKRLRLQREQAAAEARALEAASSPLRANIERDVRRAYYELAFLDGAMAVLAESQTVTTALIQSSESRYAAGLARQEEVLRLQVEAARIAEEAARFAEERRAALAQLNALLARPSDAAIDASGIPEAIKRAAVPANAAEIRFASSALGSRVLDTPLPPVATLQATAAVNNPERREFDARLAVETSRLRLAEQAHEPRFDVELQYGQRPGRSDMVSLMVSSPIPIRRNARQNQEIAAVRSELSAVQSDRAAQVQEVNAEIATLHSELEAIRSQLALYVRSILPQGRAVFESTAAGYAAGRADFPSLLESRRSLFEYQLGFERLIADFARKLAELERLVGTGVLL
ncbi:MAG: TolC family protein [Gemmatimonadota bacterium]